MNSAVMKETAEKQTVKFGDICREVKLTTKDPLADGYDKYIGLEHLDSGSLKIKRWGSVEEDSPSFTRVFKKGQILFGKRRPYLKKASIAEFDGICSSDIIVMEPKGDLMLPELLPFVVQSDGFWEWAVKTSSGSLSPRTKFSSVKEFEINGELKKNQESIRNALMLTQKVLDRIDYAIQSSSRLYDSFDYHLSKEIFEFPLKQLGDLVIKADDGPFGSKLKTEHYIDTPGTRVVRLQNIQKNYFDNSDEAYIDSDYANNVLSKHQVISGDVLIAGLGDDSFPVGRSCIYTLIDPAINKADCFRLRVNAEEITAEYLCFILNSVLLQYKMKPLIQGVTRQRINLTNLKGLMIPVPPPELQESYVDSSTSLFNTRTELEEKSNKLLRLSNNYISFS
ncbi:MAG: restriction endonuclease subunit S [Candidatus Thiodiazotropha sp. (ex Codakia rugifera)]|nr:restriction endonuclease subunit S [Candidatus Thiodiazotropha sp. (ex Codakia rugifera)]